MVSVILNPKFQQLFHKIKDKGVKEKIIKQIEKIKDNPEVGKPMRYGRRNTRELYIRPFRLSYAYVPEINTIYLLDLYHKKYQ